MSFNEEMKASISKRKGSRGRRRDNPKENFVHVVLLIWDLYEIYSLLLRVSSLKDIFFI